MEIIRIPKKGKVTYNLVMARTGARFENPDYKGISHFVEHMLFKGTKTRTCREIALGIEKYGGNLNAFTDWEITAYLATIANRHKREALDILKDITENPTFPNKEITKERQVILQELKMCEDNLRIFAYELLNKKLFNSYSGFYLPIIGTENSLNKIDRNALQSYHETYYKDLVTIQVGDVLVKEDYKLTTIPEIVFEVNSKNLNHSFFETRKDIAQANVLISNYLSPYTPELNTPKLDNLIAIDILNELYSDMSGRLFTVIREKHHLVYRIHFGREIFGCGGIQWFVGLGLDTDKIDKAHELIIEELTRPPTKKELDYAMIKLMGKMEIILNNPKFVGNIVARAVIRNIDYTQLIYNYEKHYKRVAKSINEFQKMFNFKENILVGVIPERKK